MQEECDQAGSQSAEDNFTVLLEKLAQPAAFPFAVPAGEPIDLRQTHASAVLLVKDRAYKLKKPKNFGFFDYSTPALRRHFCAEEVRLNARLAPDVYLGVAPVLALSGGQARFGPTLPAEQTPVPGALIEGGLVVDYAVVMERLPDEETLEARVRAGTARPELLEEIARFIAAFHQRVQTDAHIASFGERAVIGGNWEENFTQTLPYVGRAIDPVTYDHVASAIRHFLQARASLFAKRISEGRIRDCHGDLRLQHVSIRDGAGHSRSRLAVIDCIEFNERFRYGDVAGEVAFLTMELDAAGRPDLSRAFINAYVQETGDESLRELLPFYACYRAYVRGKVLAFQLDEPEVPADQREVALQQAQALFSLAASYVSGMPGPTLLMVGGVMGTGKSTLAAALQHELGWAYTSSDTVRKRLLGLQPAQPQAADFGAGIYSREWTERTYQGLLEEAEAALAGRRSVIVDASFIQQADRLAAARLAASYRARAMFVECVCPRDVVLERLARRWTARVAGGTGALAEASRASDGRPELYERQRANWEAFSAAQAPGLAHLQVDTAGPLAGSVEQVLAALDIPRFACWL
jgi:aminoglycoside phosphotransferase family enzyme/predicted kinase